MTGDSDASAIQERANNVRKSAIMELSEKDRVEAVVGVAHHMLQLCATNGVDELAQSAALSVQMTRWALRTTFGGITREQLSRFLGEARRGGQSTVGVMGVLLSGNVLTSPARALLLPLLMGVPVLARVSSRERTFAAALHQALTDGCPAMRALGTGLAVVEFDHGTASGLAALAALLEAVDAVAVYGSDDTCGEVARLAPDTVTVVPHGHGLGVGVLPRAALEVGVPPLEVGVPPTGTPAERLDALAAAFALDVAAYDQRGCLSPQVLYVQEDGWVSPEDVAASVHAALGRLARELPRGPLDAAAAARQAQFRGVGGALGRVFVGDSWSVTCESGLTPRPSPGYRNISVHAYRTDAELLDTLARLGGHLKVVGLAGDALDRERLASALPAPLTPRICAPGEMQTPSFTCLWDGLPPWHGLLREGSGPPRAG